MRGRGRNPVCLSRTPPRGPVSQWPVSYWQSLLHTTLRGIQIQTTAFSPALSLPPSLWVSLASSVGQCLYLLGMVAAPHGCSHHFLLFQLVTWGLWPGTLGSVWDLLTGHVTLFFLASGYSQGSVMRLNEYILPGLGCCFV